MKCLLTIRLVDESEGAVVRLSEHILRAQRLAWLSDGMNHRDAEKYCERIELQNDTRAMLELETLGRRMAYQRASSYLSSEDSPKYQASSKDECEEDDLWCEGEIHDSTVLVNEVSQGSLVVELAIPLSAFVAIYIARIVAKDREQEREFRARMRTIQAIEDQLDEKATEERRALSPKARERILKKLIDGIGAFEARIVDRFKLEIGGNTLELGTQRSRSKDQLPVLPESASVATEAPE